MSWQYAQQNGSTSYDHPSHHYDQTYPSVDRTSFIGENQDTQPIAGPSSGGINGQYAQYQDYRYDRSTNQQYPQQDAYRSSLPSHGSSSSLSNQLPPIDVSHLQQQSYDAASLPDAERLVTPGLYPYQNYLYTPPAPSYGFAQPYYSNNTYYTQPAQPIQISPEQHSTIAPTALNNSSWPKATGRGLGDLMESRGSSSSASSTENGHDWGGNTVTNFDDWARPIAKALPDPDLPPIAERQQHGFPLGPPPMTMTASTRNTAVQLALRQYINTPNRLAFGERKVIVMSPKVGQKSYGNEKRFLCPHPQACLIGGAWWRKSSEVASPLSPPRVNISLTGEQPVRDANVSWNNVTGQSLDEKMNMQPITEDDRPFLATVAGRNLHISDNDGKRKDVKALVTVRAPLRIHAGPNGWGNPLLGSGAEEVIGTFESKEIKIISKPSKKKSSSKSSELIVQHGSTIALFNRVKSQTTSTRYLSVDPDYTRILGSDGKPVTGSQIPSINTNSMFAGLTANASNWESFIIWLIDPFKQPVNTQPVQPDWPVPPPNIYSGPILPPIRYNSTVVLQSLQTGIYTPTLVIRRIEQDSEVMGNDGTCTDGTQSAPEGELPGDLVSQLHKVAFELYQPLPPPDPYYGNAPINNSIWLSCDQEQISEFTVKTDKKWIPLPPRSNSRPSSTPSTPTTRFGVLPMTPHNNTMTLPSTPTSPVSSSSSSLDYFGNHSRKSSSSALFSPISNELALPPIPPPSTDGGPIRRGRTGSTSRASNGPFARPQHRKRMSTDGHSASASSSYEYLPNAANGSPEGRMCWTLDVTDVCVWSIVSTEQITYTFFVPPYVADVEEPITPFPSIDKVYSPHQNVEYGHMKYHQEFRSRTDDPLVTFSGKNFVKSHENGAHHQVYYGSQPASYIEVRNGEIMAATEPDPVDYQRPQPIFLVREDGCLIQPTGHYYPAMG